MPASSPTDGHQPAGASHSNGFEQMIAEIRHYARSAISSAEPRCREQLVASVIANASEIFSRLAALGLSDLAYPRPLAMASLATLRQSRSRVVERSPVSLETRNGSQLDHDGLTPFVAAASR